MALTLAPRERKDLRIRVVPSGGAAIPSEAAAAREAAAAGWRDRFARVEAPGNRLCEAVVTQSIRDFASFPLLDGEPDEWLALQAGMPLYPAFFGRDAVTAG
jgi:hypothetical protein